MAKEKSKRSRARRGTKRPHPEKPAAAQPDSQDPLLTDSRFRDATWDPRFSKVPKRAKGAIDDDRFVSKLKNDTSFCEKFTPVDRFGRPKKQARVDPSLSRLAPSDDEGDDDDDEEEDSLEQQILGARDEIEVEEQNEEGENEDDDEDDDDMSDMEGFIEDGNEELENIPRGNATNRLAVVGLDWSVTRAVDILASLGSFCPTGKRIRRVEVHPSKFGLERLAVEARLGPQVIGEEDLRVVREERNKAKLEQLEHGANEDLLSDDDDENGDAQDIEEDEEEEEEEEEDGVNENEFKSWKQQAALRRYEEERLKYYYAIVEFNDVKSADAVYEQCDGVEYAQSGRAFDLRFVPDDMVIETTPRDSATSVPDGYKPPNVNLSSLNNSTVKLSWDADPPDRVVLKKKAFGKSDLAEADLKAYLASSSDDDDDDDDGDGDDDEGDDDDDKGRGRKKASREEIQKKRNLLLGIKADEKGKNDGEDEDDVDLEVSFEPGMLEKAEEILKRKQEMDESRNETEWEARLRRIRERKTEKRKQRRELLASKNRGGDDAGVQESDASSSDVAEEEGMEADAKDDDPPSFSDPFFSADRDFIEAEKAAVAKAQAKAANQKANQKTGGKGVGVGDDDDSDDEETRKRKQAELELLTMDVGLSKGKTNNNKLREKLEAADSDDDDGRLRKEARGKRSRGKRRAQKEAAKNRQLQKANKPSAVDVDDERFQGVFNSHLFAIDPTHPKYRDDDTTRKIVQEKGRRARNHPTATQHASHPGKSHTKPTPESSAQAELRQLAARVKARANAKRKGK